MTITQLQIPLVVVFVASLLAAVALSAWPASAASVVQADRDRGASNSPGSASLQQMGKGSGVRTVSDEEAEDLSDDDVNKRGWNDLSGVWGKRGWNDLSGVWGKRGWNELNGMWGKKRNNWNNLNGMWGKKRGWNDLSGMWGKRSTSNWNNLQGLWGKRSDVSPLVMQAGPNWQARPPTYLVDDGNNMDEAAPMDRHQAIVQGPIWLEH